MENRKRSLTDFFLLFCAFLHVYGLAVAAAASLDATKPPNVLILFVDGKTTVFLQVFPCVMLMNVFVYLSRVV